MGDGENVFVDKYFVYIICEIIEENIGSREVILFVVVVIYNSGFFVC